MKVEAGGYVFIIEDEQLARGIEELIREFSGVFGAESIAAVVYHHLCELFDCEEDEECNRECEECENKCGGAYENCREKYNKCVEEHEKCYSECEAACNQRKRYRSECVKECEKRCDEKYEEACDKIRGECDDRYESCLDVCYDHVCKCTTVVKVRA